MSGFSHLDEQGRVRMVDVGDKPATARSATAEGFVCMAPATLAALSAGELPKGNVLTTAHVAGVLAAKKCDELIPLCHSLPLSVVDIRFETDEKNARVRIIATCKTVSGTGVEMEALTAVSVAALTVFDMCKAIDKAMRIDGIRVLHKSGGRSGEYHAKT